MQLLLPKWEPTWAPSSDDQAIMLLKRARVNLDTRMNSFICNAITSYGTAFAEDIATSIDKSLGGFTFDTWYRMTYEEIFEERYDVYVQDDYRDMRIKFIDYMIKQLEIRHENDAGS